MHRVCITTYNRHDSLIKLQSDIIDQSEARITLFDDGSVPPVHGAIHYENHGKRRYYQLITHVFEFLRDKDFEYFWILPDDIRLNPNFFKLSVDHWNLIDDPMKVCLSVGHTHNRHHNPCWTRFQPICLGDVWLTQWNDMCFMADRRFLELLDYRIEEPKPGYNFASSGVGRYISRTLYKMGYNQYHTNESLVEFPANETKMHI